MCSSLYWLQEDDLVIAEVPAGSYLTKTVLKGEIELVYFIHGFVAGGISLFLGTFQRPTTSIDMNIDEF